VSGAVFDTGALIGFERADRAVVAIVVRALEHGETLVVPAGAVARAWRDGRRQARLARLLASPVCEVVALDDLTARAAGQLCGLRGTSDVIDASVAVIARRRQMPVVTSDRDDLHHLDPSLELVSV
jgi:hypothetical protein